MVAKRKVEMKIAFDGRLMHRKVTGLERYCRNLVCHLAELDTTNQYTIYSEEPIFEDDQLPSNYGFESAADSIDFASKILSRKGEGTADIYHMTWTGESAIDVLLIKLIPTVLTVHDLILYKEKSYFPNEYLLQRKEKVISVGIRFASRIIADSEYTRKTVCNNFDVDPEHVRTVHLACDEKFVRIDDAEKIKQTREKYGVEGKFIFNLGTDFPHKNVKNLILAFNLLMDKGAFPATLIIAGNRTSLASTRETEEALRQSPHAHNIKWIDHMPEEDLCAMYNAADVFAFPSLYEGFGLPILEAMACGTPVVTANSTSIPEVAGDAALLIDGTSVSEIAESIQKVLTDTELAGRLVQAGFQQAKKFSWDKTAGDTLQVYNELYDEIKDRDISRDLWQEWLQLHFLEIQNLERQIGELNESLRLREQHLQALLGTRTLNALRKIKRVADTIRGKAPEPED